MDQRFKNVLVKLGQSVVKLGNKTKHSDTVWFAFSFTAFIENGGYILLGNQQPPVTVYCISDKKC